MLIKKKLMQVKGSFEKGTKFNYLKKESENIKEITRPRIQVEDIKDQENNESRKVWHNVTCEILKGKFETADIEKKKIEDEQRKNKK